MLLASTISSAHSYTTSLLDNTDTNRAQVHHQLHVLLNPAKILLFTPGDHQKEWVRYRHQAIRERLIDSMSNVRRFNHGFLIQTFQNRPYIFCHLDILDNVIHPILIPTPFLPLNLPLPQGAPITLLPYATPAYFLAEYTGPTAGLVKQFEAALTGLGAGTWRPTFILAWINVENRQGEDKGLFVIYPADLCVSAPRPPLEYIPELPTPLQPSPQIVPFPRRSLSLSSPHSLYTFRALTLSKSKDLRQVATEASAYVDAVAREREKERERLRKAASSPKMTRTPAAESSSSSVPPPPALPPPPPLAPAPEQQQQQPQHLQPLQQQHQPQQLPQQHAQPPVPTQLPQPTPQTFYPSPPLIPPPPPVQATSSMSTSMNSYDPYSMDDSWAQSSTDYLNMDMDMNLDMGMAMSFDFNPNTSSSGVGRSGAEHERSFSMMDDAFTDDDFSFFDQPKVPAPRPPSPQPLHQPHQHQHGWGATPTAFMLPDGFTPRSIDSGPPDMGAIPSSSPMPETPGMGLLPPAASTTPGVNTSTSSGSTSSSASSYPPLTPNVHIDSSADTPLKGPFEPIPFAPYHREIDGKYAVGKFALPLSSSDFSSASSFDYSYTPSFSSAASLPSPPPEEEDMLMKRLSLSLSTPTSMLARPKARMQRTWTGTDLRMGTSTPTGGWRSRYDAVTDPRIGVVKKLIGVKRKTRDKQHLLRGSSASPPSWVRMKPNSAYEMAEMVRGMERPVQWEMEKEEHESEVEDEEDEDGESDEEDDDDDLDDDSPTLSRPTTPPPSYLPLGPTLLQTQFRHAHLLPLSIPLRPPGAAIAATPLNSASSTHSGVGSSHPHPAVPTPVSPAATIGAAKERSKSLELAAFAMAAEAVENPVWAEAWFAVNAPASSSLSSPSQEVWSADVRVVAKRLEEVKAFAGLEMKAPLTLEELFGLKEEERDHQPLEDPMISVGKGVALVDLDVSSLRFWDKLGLGPKSGKKDLGAFVLYDESGPMGSRMEGWFRAVRDVYQAKRYGTMSPGQSSASEDGLVPLRLDATFRKSLINFITNLSSSPHHVHVVFLVLPVTVMSLASPPLRQILAVLKKVLSGPYAAGQLFFQFVPEPHILIAQQKAPAWNSALDQLVASVYNRIRIPVDRLRSKGVQERLDEKIEFAGGFASTAAGDEYGDAAVHQNKSMGLIKGTTTANTATSLSRSSLRKTFIAPLFTLARPLASSKVSFMRSKRAPLDVLDRHALLHVAYHLTACRRWIMACCVDWRGDAYDLKVWLAQRSVGGGTGGVGVADGDGDGDVDMEGVRAGATGQGGTEGAGDPGGGVGGGGQGSRAPTEVMGDEECAVRKVWEFGMEFAKQANVEWRVVFARLGVMGEKEMTVWTNLFNSNVVPARTQPPLHHSVVCVVPDAPWHFIPSSKDGVASPFSKLQSHSSPISSVNSSRPAATTSASTTSLPTSSSNATTTTGITSKQPAVFKDITSTTYAIYPTVRLPMSMAPSLQADLGLNQSCVADPLPLSSSYPESNCNSGDDLSTMPPPPPMLPVPIASSILIRVPHPSSTNPSASMINIHLMRTAHSHSASSGRARSTDDGKGKGKMSAVEEAEEEDKSLLEDVTRSYHSLGVLARARGLDPGKYANGSGRSKGLPFHVAAVDLMRLVLDRDWDRLDAGVDL
ncbi:hypothetical protein D9613_011497 [Agrocybe pediades]|uniref:Mediator of RNA polymerase II transcription subunit 13 n=1 Tax=Agrocybe pediades TaxID=84607 RepID=A0A8H4VND3_9AGAR|nr:hypothetical protein D9613_011497 [Agrocybe pediades]